MLPELLIFIKGTDMSKLRSNSNLAFFEKNKSGEIVHVNRRYLDDLGLDEASVTGKAEVGIDLLKPFAGLYSIGEREAILTGTLSIRKELFYFRETGVSSVITTRKYVNSGDIGIRGFYFKIGDTPVIWDGQRIHVTNYHTTVKLSLFKFFVLLLKCRGHSNHSISKITCRAESTVRNITQDLYCKFDVFDFVTLARYFDLGGWLNELTLSLIENYLSGEKIKNVAIS